MSVEQIFLQWYAQLFPDDQNTLCNFLINWLNPQLVSNLPASYLQPLVVQSFLQGYAQLSPNEQQALCNFLRNWFNPPPSSRRINPPSFTGKFVAPVSSNVVDNPQKIKCPECGHEFELNH